MKPLKKRKSNKLFGDFFYVVYKNDKEIKTVYEWKPGEKEEYFKVCELVEGWGGIPMDVGWAKSTTIYKEAFEKFKKIK